MDHLTIENINFVVPPDSHECRLDIFIFQTCDLLPSRSYAAKLIKNGLVLVNKKIRKASFELSAGDSIDIDISFLNENKENPQAEDISLDILFEDEDILIINKPAGLVVHPGAGVSSGTLVNALLAHCGAAIPTLDGATRAGIVHRLDRDTSGVMVTAKTQAALTKLSGQFAEHSHKRVYHAICYGEFEDQSGKVETGHIRDPNNRLKYKSVELGEGKRASLSYRVLKLLAKHNLSLVECTLETGRTHQIRVQMHHLNHAIVGDALYSRIPDKLQHNHKALAAHIKKTAQRQMLHATLLEITHPTTQERISFTAPYPNDFDTFLSSLEGFSH